MLKRITLTTAALVATQLVAGDATAQLWNPLDTRPKANMVIGLDTSVTMRIRPNCSGCHRTSYHPRQRVAFVNRALSQTLPLFDDLFNYGSFVYSGSGFAKIRTDRGRNRVSLAPRIPNPERPEASFRAVLNVVNNLDAQGRSERRLPGGQDVACLTPTANCSGDNAAVDAFLANPPGGLRLPAITANAITCDVGVAAGQQINPLDEFRRQLRGFNWPRYNQPVDEAEVQRDFCQNLTGAANVLRQELSLCTSTPEQFVDSSQANCNATALSNSLCAPGSTLSNTCICNPTAEGCGGGQRVSECGVPYDFKVRQQFALCASYQPNGPFGRYFRSQPDNIVNADGCRENALLMFTDGYRGNTAGVQGEAQALTRTYRAADGNSNAFVFRVAEPFRSSADRMAQLLSNGRQTEAYDATDLPEMINSFATISNRILQGTYTGSSPTFDNFATRVALQTFTVPGNRGAPDIRGRPAEQYYGRPARISWHEVTPDGQLNPEPIFETDWSENVGVRQELRGPGADPSADAALGPRGNWRSGIEKIIEHAPNTLDRNGDGVIARDEHEQRVTWGYMFGGGNTQPVVVEAPRDIPTGADAVGFSTFQQSVRERPRVIYALSNGYLHAFHAGAYRRGGVGRPEALLPRPTGRRGAPPSVVREFIYDDSVRDAGTELFRYRPTWTEGVADLSLNDLRQQTVMDGQIIVREVQLSTSRPRARPQDFATLLVMSQGRLGPGYSALNVSDPNRPRVLWETRLPAGDTATSEPGIYEFPGAGANPTLVVTGGLGGSPNLYAIDARSGRIGARIALPGGTDYPTSPVCLDATGASVVTQCYVLARNGTLVRVTITLEGNRVGQFEAATPITPPGVQGGGRTFFTPPAVYFGTDNAVNLMFASGDIESLQAPSAAENAIFKVVDRSSVLTTGGATIDGVCRPEQTDDRSGRGFFALNPGEMVISPPTVAKGIVAFTTYTPGASGCVSGTGRLFGFDFETCGPALDRGPGRQPQGLPFQNIGVSPRDRAVDLGAGIHTSPLLLRSSEQLVTFSSANPTAAGTTTQDAATRGGGRAPIKRLYWRPVLTAP